ncbi:MAG TPA: potassium transporter Trk [Acidimicrobiia bacterium]|nr:potassium transporter Trk [Acidimicrobiia bacterium]
MADVLLLALFTGFFALAVLFVKGCERIVGAETETVPDAVNTFEERTAA